jgi:germination protein M
VRLSLLGLVAVLLLAGCGGGDEAATDTATTTAPVETTTLGVYWLYEGKVWPAMREVDETQAVATAALEELLAGPTDEEEVQFSFSTAIPEGAELGPVSVEDGVARVRLTGDLSEEALAQVVYTASQFPTVDSTGTANTFEATFQYELADTDGKVVDSGVVTATSGSGTRGTFDFTTNEYEIPFDGVGALFVFEISMEDGSRINLREIPVRMAE